MLWLIPAAAITLVGCKKEQPAPPAPPEVSVMKAVTKSAPVVAEFVGQVVSSREVHIVSRVNGFLEKRLYAEGEPVMSGQPLYQIDPKPFQAEVLGAKAALAQSEAAHSVAKSNMARIAPLVALNAASQKDLDQADGMEKTTAAAVESAKARLVQAELDLGYTRILSPVNGISTQSLVGEGTYVTPAAALTTVSQVAPIWVHFSIPANALLFSKEKEAKGLLKIPNLKDARVELRLADGTLFPEQGKVVFTNPQFEPKTNTFLMRAEYQNRGAVLRPGQFVTARLLGMTLPSVVVLPQKAVLQAAKGHYVMVVDDKGVAVPRTVEVGAFQGDDWMIEKGLSDGDVVIVDGGAFLKPGAQVRPVPVSGN